MYIIEKQKELEHNSDYNACRIIYELNLIKKISFCLYITKMCYYLKYYNYHKLP